MPNVRDASAEAHRKTVEASISDIAAFPGSSPKSCRLHGRGLGDANGQSLGKERVASPTQQTKSACGMRTTSSACSTPRRARTRCALGSSVNPQLDDESPTSAIREDRARDVLVAARAFLAGG